MRADVYQAIRADLEAYLRPMTERGTRTQRWQWQEPLNDLRGDQDVAKLPGIIRVVRELTEVFSPADMPRVDAIERCFNARINDGGR